MTVLSTLGRAVWVGTFFWSGRDLVSIKIKEQIATDKVKPYGVLVVDKRKPPVTVLDQLRIAFKVMGFYLKKMIVPWPLNFEIK